jgi:hypothetical protein
VNVLVPAPVQQEIVQQAPALAYAPSRLAPGWSYGHWGAANGTLVIAFTKAGKEIDFLVRAGKGNCAQGSEKTFQMAGVKVYWQHTAAEQRAWRCVNGKTLLGITSLPPNRFAPEGIGRMVASGHRLSR